MDNYLNQPSSSSGPLPVPEKDPGKGNAIFEYCGENGETVIFEAPESSIYYDDEGNAVICAENLEELSQNVVHEEVIEYEDEEYTSEPSTSHVTNKSVTFKKSYPKNRTLMTKKSLEADKAALFAKAGRKKKPDPSQIVKPNKTVNENGSILNRNIPGMKNMFKVVSDSTIMKVDKAFENERLNKKSESPIPEAHPSNPITGQDDDEEDDEEGDKKRPPKLEKCPKVQNTEIEEDPGSYDQWPLFSKSAIDFKDACEILVGSIAVPGNRVCKSLPMEYKQEGTFVVDLRLLDQSTSLMDDENGKWGQPSGKYRYYKEDQSGKLTRADDGRGKLKEWTTDYTYKIMLKRYDNSATKSMSTDEGLGHFQKKIYTGFTPSEKMKVAFAVITYSWTNGRPWNFLIQASCSKEKCSTGPKKIVKNWERESMNKTSLTSMPQIISAFFEGFNLYSHTAIDFNEAAAILLGGTIVDANKKCGSVPTGFKQNGTFVIDLKRMGYNILELRRDDNGIWTKPSGFSRFYKFDTNGDAARVDRCGKLRDGIDYDVKVLCKRYDHPQTGKNFVKKIYTIKGKHDDHYEGSPCLAVIVYFWKGKPVHFDSNAKQNSVRTERTEFAKLQEMDDEDDSFVEAPSAINEPDVEEVHAFRGPVDSRKRQRVDSHLEHVIVSEESHMNELKMNVLRREHENQDRFSMILDRAESLLTHLEQRVSLIEYETSGPQVWHPDGTEVIEEVVVQHDMAEYQ